MSQRRVQETSRKIALSHPFGSPFAYNAVAALADAGLLSCFYTTLFAPLGLKQRFHPDIQSAPRRTFPLRESLRLLATRLPVRLYNARSTQAIDRVVRAFDRSVAAALPASGLDAIYSFEDGAAETFRVARDRGIRTIYDLPIGYHREAQELFRAEAERWPELAPFLEALKETPDKLRRKVREIELADEIIVASSFTKQSLVRHVSPAARVSVVPYGSDIEEAPKIWTAADLDGPLRIMYAGTLTPRKGIHYLFEALTLLPKDSVRLEIAGRWPPGYREWIERRYPIAYNYLGQVEHCRLFDVYRRNHVFVFPSLFEGFGLVLLEALACGIPIVGTERTGAPDIIQDFVEGRLTRAGDARHLADTLEWFCNRRSELPDLGQRARALAETMSWSAYRKNVARLISSFLD